MMYPQIKAPKGILDIAGANHFEPTDLGRDRLSNPIGQFFACKLNGDCTALAGVCSDASIPWAKCDTSQLTG